MFQSELIVKRQIYQQIETYQKAVQDIEQAYALLEQAQALLTQEFSEARYTFSGVLPGHYNISSARETALLKIKEDVWKSFVDLLGIRKLLSIKKSEELDQQLSHPKDLPEITQETVYATLLSLVEQAPDFTKQACLEVFEWLRPSEYERRNYKTNQKSSWRIGQKIIKSGVTIGYHGKFSVNYWYEKNYTALDKVFHALDGKGIPGGYRSPLVDAINNTTVSNGKGETDYFAFQCYKNGNIHIIFKRADLVQELNRIGGDGSLPGVA